MENTKAQNTKRNLQGKLRLKRSNIDSPQNILRSDTKITFENEAHRQQICSNKQSFHKENLKSNSEDNEEDSLADFKSPKQETIRKPIPNKYKIDAEKAKRKTIKPKSKSLLKSRKSNAKQPSIEFSMSKPQTSNQNQPDLKEAVPCPVCLKPFKDDTTCTNHMKSCAAKNNVSIKQLLEAKRLQDRQAQERKAIGLLAAPAIPEKRKAFRSKNFSTADDPQLQLVLAISESLYEAQRTVELEEAAFLAGISPECVKEMNDEERKRTLQSFGFSSSKPVTDAPTNRQRKKKLVAPTVLQTRSKEDKDRVLTERIACILTGDDALTQVQENAAICFENKTPTVIISELLKNIEETDNKLWDQSRLTKQSHNFYVNTLKPHFVKSAQPVESKTYEFLDKDCDKQITTTLNTSIVYEPMDLDIIINNQEMEQTNSNCEVLSTNKLKHDNFELEFMQNFSNNWKEALNDSSASDVVIFVKNNKHIYAHKLVFHMQCSNILLDIEPLEAGIHPQIEKKVSWLDKEQISALAFLEFIYSGTISKYVNIFYQDELVHQVEQLARLYKKQNLFTYIRKKQKKFKFERKDSEQLKSSNNMQEKSSINSNQYEHKELAQKSNDLNNESIPFEIQVTQKNPSKNLNESSNKLIPKEVVSNNVLTKHSIDRQITASPDLFDSEEDEANSSIIKIENNLDLENDAPANYNIKGEIDCTQDSDQSEHLNSQKTLVNLSRSVSPSEYIHDAVTPPLGRSPAREVNLFKEHSVFNEQEIAEAITPKCQSPETIVEIKQEIINSEKDDLCNAVTPEYNSTTEANDPITPKKLVYTDIEIHDTAPQGNVDESIYTAVTPPRYTEQTVHIIDQNVHKVKSELTMFIEKVQRRNARDILDTDSETDTPNNRARHKNPFLKRDQDDSYRYLRNARDQNYHKAISLLEKDVLNDQKENKNLDNVEIYSDRNIKERSEHIKNAEPSTSKLSTSVSSDSLLNLKMPHNSNSTSHSENTKDAYPSDEEVQDITVDETEMSMYSKYKRSTKYDNSIAVYRERLNFSGPKSCADGKVESKLIAGEDSNDSNYSKTSRSAVSHNVSEKKPKPRIIEDITLVSDSDEEESPLRTFLRDKSKKKIHRSSPVKDLSKKDTKINAPTQVSNIENDSTFPLELVNEPLESNNKNSKVFNSVVLKEKSKNKVIDLSVDSDEDGIHDDSTFPNDLVVQLDASFNKEKSSTKELQPSISKQKELEMAEKKSEDIDAEISRILQSSQEITNSRENLPNDQEKIDEKKGDNEVISTNLNTRDLNSKRKVADSSPISIVSSPEICELSKNHSQKSKNNVTDSNSNNYSQNSEGGLALGENGDFDLLDFNDWDVKAHPNETAKSLQSVSGSPRKSLSVKKLNYDDPPLSNVQSAHLNAMSNPLKLKDEKMSTLMTSPILSQSRSSLQGFQEKSLKINSRLTKKSVSPEQNPRDRKKLKIKSASTSALAEKIKADKPIDSLQRSSSFVTPEIKKKSSNNHKDMTPPMNYSLLDTPDLQKELKKFGLKPQSRTKAKALLAHIYQETHSQSSASQKRTSSTNSSSDEDEPPAKRQNIRKTIKKLDAKNKHCSKAEKSCVIAEEMDFEEPDVANIFQNPVSIKDAFFKLIKTNRELYNKVLTYEPLPLESLHIILKQNGFKCKINCLMNVLDEQCITFQVKTNKGDRTKK